MILYAPNLATPDVDSIDPKRLWKLPRCGNGGKQNAFSTVSTALGKLAKERRVFHSSHSRCGWTIEQKEIKTKTFLMPYS